MQVDFIWRRFIHLRMLFKKYICIELSFKVECRIYGNRKKTFITFTLQVLSLTLNAFF